LWPLAPVLFFVHPDVYIIFHLPRFCGAIGRPVDPPGDGPDATIV